MTTPTMPPKQPPDDDLEAGLRASFERATKRAQGDLADGRLAAEAIDRGRRRARRAPTLRAGLVLAAVAVLGAGTMLAVGGRPSPSPSPAPSVAVADETPHAAGSLVPTDANGSQIPVPEGSGFPVLDAGQSFPPTVDGQPVFALGGPAEAQLAKATDATPVYISGWYLPLERASSCFAESFASMAPGVTYYDKCATGLLFATPTGGASLQFLVGIATTGPVPFGFGGQAATAYVNREIIKVHLNDPACTIPECATEPALDGIVMTAWPIMNPLVARQTPPAKVISMAEAISAALPTAQDAVGIGGDQPVLVSAEFGIAVVLCDINVQGDPVTTWEWKVTFVSTDGIVVDTVWVDALTGESNHSGSTTGGGFANP
ncbi:MAG: hypothetical protein ACYDAN_12360 [Candidatus Limnocylindrales bacterium]